VHLKRKDQCSRNGEMRSKQIDWLDAEVGVKS
jgi:hypothetical protein